MMAWRNSLEAAAERAERREARASRWPQRWRKVDPLLAALISAELRAGEKHEYLAALHGLSLKTIGRIKHGVTP